MSRDLPPFPLAIVACALLVLIGSFGPWAVFPGFETTMGTETDGGYTLALAFSAGTAGAWQVYRRRTVRWLTWIALVAFLLALLVGVIDLVDANRLDPEAVEADLEADRGWGLILVTIGAIAGLATTGWVLFGDRFRRRVRGATPARR